MATVPFESITRRKNAYGLYWLRKLHSTLSTGIGYSSLYEGNGKFTEIAKPAEPVNHTTLFVEGTGRKVSVNENRGKAEHPGELQICEEPYEKGAI